MSKDNRNSYSFVQLNYNSQKRFSSFLPAISGIDGKPTWVFYANVGQCIASFGVDNKDTPLTPFDSAVLAYQNIPLKGFRTFIFIDGKLYQPFLDEGKTKLEINYSNIKISYENDEYEIVVTYSTVPHSSYAGLIRKVAITNKSNKEHKFDVIDGLPIFLPKGLSNYLYHQMTTLAASYCKIDTINNASWYSFLNRGEDNSTYVKKDDGSGFLSLDKSNNKLLNIVDAKAIFGNDESFLKVLPLEMIKKNIDNQEYSNHIPSAFNAVSKSLKPNEELSFVSLFGTFDNPAHFNSVSNEISYRNLDEMINSSEEIITSLLPKIETNNEDLNNYLKQSFLDNGLRGGFPYIYRDKLCYLYSRKHGDLERDYNSFSIPSTYFSSGFGNFRDINQNRRNDLIIEPRVNDYNIYLFFSLIENNGFNPLQVDISLLHEDVNSFEEAEVKIASLDLADINAKYVEGYWIDHFSYNVDLINNYLSIYPDKETSLFNDKKYRFFDSGMHLKTRFQRYQKTENGIRQYNSLEPLEEHKSNWLINPRNNKVVTVSLASKIFDLLIKKVTTLDVDHMGLEMLSDKPGWNDSCNGLPGLFASSMCETIELLRLLKLFKEKYQKHHYEIEVTAATYLLLEKINNIESSGFAFWNEINVARGAFEDSYRNDVDLISIDESLINKFVNKYEEILTNGIKKAIELGKGIIPTYFIHELVEYKEQDGFIVPLRFETRILPSFLEAPARLLKLNSFANSKMIEEIEKSDLYDKELGIFKTSLSLDTVSKEIGRVTLFQKGWLERESDFLHMTFKYLLGLLKAGYYKAFFKYVKTNFPCFMDPNIYSRSIYENVSFIVPSNHPNKNEIGSGHYARLTGANTEVINMYQLIFFGEEIIKSNNGELSFNFTPHIPLELFNENNELVVSLFNISVRYKNINKRDYNNQSNIRITIDGKEISSSQIEAIRNKTLSPNEIVVEIL